MRTRRWKRGTTVVVLCVIIVLAWPGRDDPVVLAQSLEGTEALHPRQHFKLDNPGSLNKQDAETIYSTIAEHMAETYGQSGVPGAATYQRWTRFNDAPFRSEAHGERYVNAYGNAIAEKGGYAEHKAGVAMPAGSILAKDSFTFTANRALFGGALFLMEKLPPGANPPTGDWRYAMVLPDGSIFADSKEDPDRLTFCHDCHATVERFDYLFFVPKDYRR